MNFHIEYEHETDGRWLAEVPEIPPMAPLPTKPWLKQKHWRFAYLLIALKPGKTALCQSALNSLQHESVALCKG